MSTEKQDFPHQKFLRTHCLWQWDTSITFISVFFFFPNLILNIYNIICFSLAEIMDELLLSEIYRRSHEQRRNREGVNFYLQNVLFLELKKNTVSFMQESFAYLACDITLRAVNIV